MCLILNIIYQSTFRDSSHGLRFNKGNHLVFYYIKYHVNCVRWCIEANIDNNYPSISHKILLNILGKRVRCFKSLALIKNFIKVGYRENGKFSELGRGLFQKNSISSILNNVYFHEFDIFIHSLADSFVKGSRRQTPQVYCKIFCEISKFNF
jgi:retron-type reverse transcriptase